MKFNFIREDGQTEEINVTCFIGRHESEASYLNNLLKAEAQPISFEVTRRIFNTCKQHAQQQYNYGREITMDAPNSSTAQAYRRMMREGLRGDDDFDAISRVMDRLVKRQATPVASTTPPPAPFPLSQRIAKHHGITPGYSFPLVDPSVEPLQVLPPDDELRTLVIEATQKVGQEGVITVDTCDLELNDAEEVASILAAISTRTTDLVKPLHQHGFYGAQAARGGTTSYGPRPPSPASLD